MHGRQPAQARPWMLFAFPAAIAVLIVAGILLGGPAVGFLAATGVAAVIVVAAVRMDPRRRPRPDATADRGWRRAAARRFLVPLAILAGGILVVAIGDGTTRAVGWGIIAIAVTITMSLVFLEIGYSEDRARARESRPRRE